MQGARNGSNTSWRWRFVVLGAVWSPFLQLSTSFYTCCDQIQEDDILMEDFVHPLLERFSVEKAGLRGVCGVCGVREVGANGERFTAG